MDPLAMVEIAASEGGAKEMEHAARSLAGELERRRRNDTEAGFSAFAAAIREACGDAAADLDGGERKAFMLGVACGLAGGASSLASRFDPEAIRDWCSNGDPSAVALMSVMYDLSDDGHGWVSASDLAGVFGVDPPGLTRTMADALLNGAAECRVIDGETCYALGPEALAICRGAFAGTSAIHGE